MDEYEVHPAADLFPMMTDAELDALGEDMLQNAQREEIILYRGKILDGRNRYRACLLNRTSPFIFARALRGLGKFGSGLIS